MVCWNLVEQSQFVWRAKVNFHQTRKRKDSFIGLCVHKSETDDNNIYSLVFKIVYTIKIHDNSYWNLYKILDNTKDNVDNMTSAYSYL